MATANLVSGIGIFLLSPIAHLSGGNNVSTWQTFDSRCIKADDPLQRGSHQMKTSVPESLPHSL